MYSYQILRDHEEARSWGISEDEAESTVTETLDSLKTGVEEASAAYPGAGKRHETNALRRIAKLKKNNDESAGGSPRQLPAPYDSTTDTKVPLSQSLSI